MNRLSVNGEKRAVHRLGLHLVFLSLIIAHIRRFLYLEQVAVGQGPRRGWGWGGFSPPTFLAVDVRTLNVQLEI